MKKSRKITIILLLLSASALFLTGACALLSWCFEADLDEAKLPSAVGSVCVLDANGDAIPNDNYAKLSEISENIQNAFIAVEDKRFYSHHGIDPLRIAGAIKENVRTHRFSQGASTITCQLVKNTLLDPDKTLKRKVKEAILARKLERKYTKSEILEMYLNVLYFGKGVYGIKNASRTIFGKEPSEIGEYEAACLAATVKNPSAYSPLIDANKNIERAKIVLSLMREQGLTDRANPSSEPDIIINCNNFNNNYCNSYTNSVLFEAQKLLKINKADLKNKGYIIHSYFDPNAQKAIDFALSSNIEAFCEDGSPAEKEILLADNKTRGVVAYGSTAKSATAFSEPRQPGSAIKPFIYAAAIAEGQLLPDTPILDEKTAFGSYTPSNYSDAYLGWTDAKTALAKSSNVAAVKILRELGVENAYRFLEKCGFSLSENDLNLALALGGTTYGSKITELCEAYQTLANEGRRKELHFIKKITDKNGNTIYADRSLPDSVMPESVAYLTTTMLRSAVKIGTASQLSYLDFDVAAKTGTVARGQGNSDAWIAGYTTAHTFAIRYGAPSGKTLQNNVTGGNQAAKTARSALRELYKVAPKSFGKPQDVRCETVSSYAKNELHSLVRFQDFPIGESEIIEVSSRFPLKKPNFEEFFLDNFRISTENKSLVVRFDARAEIDYAVFVNGRSCTGKDGVYRIKKFRPGLAKIRILCKSGETALFDKVKWVIV